CDGSCFCVGPTSTGDGSGRDWSNQKAWSSPPARGDTWYLRGGAYASKTLNAPESGTTLITIRKASPTDHVTNAGWQASYGTEPASWTDAGITFANGYYLFDGAYRNEADWFDGSAYGFTFTSLALTDIFNFLGGVNHVTVKYVHTVRGVFTPSTMPDGP